ncbi:hypothetical protein DFJ58DRAFT_763869, partial [Suillus subalutaceus]|uniref:uncharacterized protein n=1 Tax=Suillus subalutaceus TaxID=48586 RepID=UPI001B87039C
MLLSVHQPSCSLSLLTHHLLISLSIGVCARRILSRLLDGCTLNLMFNIYTHCSIFRLVATRGDLFPTTASSAAL